jgi:hypothetical protein
MYIIQPDYEAEQAITNRINANTRHCRIGKVRHKTGIRWADSPLRDIMKPQPVIPGPFINIHQPWWMQGPFCDTTGVPPIKGYGSQCVAA